MTKIKRILISQPQPTTEKSPYFDLEKKYDVKLDFKPFIKIEPVPARDFRTQKVNPLDYTAVIFTAKAGIDHFFRLRDEMRFTTPDTMKYFCTSEQISLYLQKYIAYRKRKVFFGDNGTLAELAEIIKKHADEKYMVVMSDVHDANKSVNEAKKDIIDYLDESKVSYARAIMYKTVATDFTKEPDFDKYDMLVFFSPSGINSLFTNFPDFKQGDTKIACFGPTTQKAAADNGLTVNVIPTPEFPSMPAAIEEFLKKQ
ncbi:MAG: uroporphyrinogen-III synthase [Paludibacteraceae bacterium]|nr:uroporphyrinogen-III synthase [Candidatus Physcocola equi]MCQ2235150.1 uroporphyrinogen-III synthase [Paludibacteraceae bacterium]